MARAQPTQRCSTEEHRLKNSIVTLEHGPAGTIARVDTGFGRYYVGPLPEETVAAIKEVSR